MNVKILKPKEALSAEEEFDVKGGLGPSLNLTSMECTCDCFIGNTNTEIPEKPSKPIKTPQ